MPENYEPIPQTGSDVTLGETSTVDAAKHEAADLKDTAVEQAKDVAATVKDEASVVLGEAKSQAKDLYAQTQQELKEQANTQQQRIAAGLKSVGAELRAMAANSAGAANSGVATDIVQQLSGRLSGAATWLGDRDASARADRGQAVRAAQAGHVHHRGGHRRHRVRSSDAGPRGQRGRRQRGRGRPHERGSAHEPAGRGRVADAERADSRGHDRGGGDPALRPVHRRHTAMRSARRVAAMTDPTPSEAKAASTSLGDLLAEVSRDISTLMRQELELAKAELKVSATRTAKAGGLLGGAGYGALMAVFFLSVALWWWLATGIGGGWAGVVVALIWAAIALVLYLVGRNRLKEVNGAPQTVETLKEIPETLKRNEENR